MGLNIKLILRTETNKICARKRILNYFLKPQSDLFLYFYMIKLQDIWVLIGKDEQQRKKSISQAKRFSKFHRIHLTVEFGNTNKKNSGRILELNECDMMKKKLWCGILAYKKWERKWTSHIIVEKLL